MRTLTDIVGDKLAVVKVVQTERDIMQFMSWHYNQELVALDTESTGLDIFSPGYRVRLVQFSDDRESYILCPERHNDHIAAIQWALDRGVPTIVHNAPHDVLSLSVGEIGIDPSRWLDSVIDTKIISHIIDPRSKVEGGVGHGLKDLSSHYLSHNAADADKRLKVEFRRLKFKLSEAWSEIDLDNAVYLWYSGLDPILTYRLYQVFKKKIKSEELVKFEHDLLKETIKMQQRGMRLDVEYTSELVRKFEEEESRWAEAATAYGVTSVNATAQVSEALVREGVRLTEKTPTGKLKVDSAILESIKHPLAEAVTNAKRARKWKTAYAEACLELRDGKDRVHPSIHSLQARTGRMSISAPPLQQLPSNDWIIRRCFIPDEGMSLGGVDYEAIEMRILAAMAKETRMLEAIQGGRDLHDYTASLMFGPSFTKAQRKLAKGVGFGKVYGGGPATLSRQTGIAIDLVRKATSKYDEIYPSVKIFAKRVENYAKQYGFIKTPLGRILPVDADRPYSATNYVIQSTARDVLAKAILNLRNAGLSDFLLLPVHDEVLVSAPSEDMIEIINKVAKVMTTDFMGIPLTATPTIYGKSWGHGYGAPD
ncbi:MAG: DNA polymerase [Nitrospira sp.]|nr:DNA polymerase [Nitrospira sp.]